MLYNMYLAILLFSLSGALFLGLLVITRVVCYFTKKTKIREIKSGGGREERKNKMSFARQKLN